jgi:V/A-type H+-transporting ATPase subunit E
LLSNNKKKEIENMPTNIESFVKTLESEGVDAGRKAAMKIEAEAREKADEINAEAKEKADQIIAEAQADAEKIQARMNSSLELATRDAIFLLREKLSLQLNNILKLNVEQALNEEETLVNVLREVIPAYAKADAENKLTTQINISDNIKSRLLETSLRELARSLNNQNVQLDISYNLAKEGFEYKIEGSTVEVSTDSVTSLLAEMIDPGLQQFLEKAANSESNE